MHLIPLEPATNRIYRSDVVGVPTTDKLDDGSIVIDPAGGIYKYESGSWVTLLSGFTGRVNPQTGTSYTATQKDSCGVIVLTNAAAIALNLPKTLPVGFNVMAVQGGAGQVTATPAVGATLVNSNGYTKTRAQYSALSFVVIANADGESAVYLMAGDGA